MKAFFIGKSDKILSVYIIFTILVSPNVIGYSKSVFRKKNFIKLIYFNIHKYFRLLILEK